MRVMNAVVGLWSDTTDKYEEYRPMIYHNGEWQRVLPYVGFEGEWAPVGHTGTLMIPFITKDGEYFYTSDGLMFLVRSHD